MSDSAAEHYMTGLGLSQYVYGAERLGLPAKEILIASGLDPVTAVQPAQRIPQRQYEVLFCNLLCKAVTNISVSISAIR